MKNEFNICPTIIKSKNKKPHTWRWVYIVWKPTWDIKTYSFSGHEVNCFYNKECFEKGDCTLIKKFRVYYTDSIYCGTMEEFNNYVCRRALEAYKEGKKSYTY